ncbi:MAG TPA: methyltransferase domain-containing protein [Opitutaceae bacterium]|nr:methyltransferase domain-containing protein [Opitutaceae bacterium]HRJ46795.1 methyltransferase domain-containing protein [Opitutaceae bacterium]
MTRLDRFIQRWRIRQAAKFIPPAARVIDIGAHQGELFDFLGNRLVAGFGIEPLLETPLRTARHELHPGLFPAVRPAAGGWDAVTMLAVLEHIPPPAQREIAAACAQLLKPGGRVIITVPSPTVDIILSALRFCRLIDGMSLEQHYGFKPGDTLKLFAAPEFRLHHRGSFQMGLNHLFVFEKS